MELNYNLSEKLLDDEHKYQENEDQTNRVEYVDNMAYLHNFKKFEEMDTDKLDDMKKPLISKKNKPKKTVKFGKLNSFEEKRKIFLKPKVIIHFLLVIFTTLQALLILNPITTNLRAQERIFYNIFIENSPKEHNDFNKVLYLYDINELRNHFKQTINNFFNLENFLLNKISYLRNYTVVEFFYFEDKYMDNLNRELFLKNESLLENNIYNDDTFKDKLNEYNDFNNTQDFINNKVTNYKITKERFGPFALDNKSLKIFLNDVKYFRVNYRFHIYTIDEVSGEDRCNEWSIYQKYNFKSRSYFVSELDFSVQTCTNKQPMSEFQSMMPNSVELSNKNFIDSSSRLNKFINELIWIHIITIIIASYSMYRCWLYITKFSSKFMDEKDKKKKLKKKVALKIKKDGENTEESSHESEFYNPLFTSSSSNDEKDKKQENQAISRSREYNFKNNTNKKVFNFWNILCLCANLTQIIASGYSLVFINNPPFMVNFLIGLGCMLALINIARYIPYSTDYAMIYETLNISFPMVIRYISGVLPMFIGFILFGYCLFWESERFGSISSTMRTLFSMINGDSVYATFEDLKRDNFFISQIYLYVFNVSFLIIFLNIFISIIEESYVVAKIRNKTSFIYKYLRIDSKLVNPKIKSKKSLVVTENFFKEKAEEELMNETRMQSSDNFSYNQLFQQKSLIKLLEEEKNSFSDNKFNFINNIENSFKPKSVTDVTSDNKNGGNIVLINKDASENTSKNENDPNSSNKNKKNYNKFDNNYGLKKYNLDELINIENQKVNDSRDKGDSDQMISLLEKDLEDDLLIIDEEAFSEKFKSIENSYDKIEFITEKIGSLDKGDRDYITNFTSRNLKLVNDKLQKIKEIWMKSNNNLFNTSAREI